MQLNTRRLFLELLSRLDIDVVCDVGSMNGADALAFRRTLPRARVLAFEPNPGNLARMRADPALGAGGIEIVPLAASDRDGEAPFFLVKADYSAAHDRRGMSSLHERADAALRDAMIVARTARLDSVVPADGGRRVALWLDVEGAAYEALEGATRLLDAVQLVHVEVETVPCIGARQKLYADVRRLLELAGFEELGTDRVRRAEQFNALYVRSRRPAAQRRAIVWRAYWLALRRAAGITARATVRAMVPGRPSLAALRRLFGGHERIFRALHALSLQEQAAGVLEPGPGRVLVLAPHMDDEVLGCGGTLAAHVAAGARVGAVYLTDGRYHAAPGGDAQAALVAQRRAEAEAAARELGIAELHFIDGTGNRLESDAAAAGRLRAILAAFRPDVIYLPSALERHPDHRSTGDVLAHAVRSLDLACECRAYEVWTPLVPNRVVPIDATVDRKRAALACYASQLEHSDFHHTALALNAYRSSLVPGGACRHAEAFHVLPLARYLALHRQLREVCDS